VYLDSAATSQTPRRVLDAMQDYYEHHRASVHRGVYPIAAEATDLFEGARHRIAAFVGGDARTTVFTRNATEAMNLVARGTAGPGDKVVLTEMEHHSNIVPWQMTGREILWVPVDADGRLDLDVLDGFLAAGGVKVVACVHVSNVLGTINPVAEIAARARAAGALSVVDGTQAVPQLPVDVAQVDADFYAWTGHKAYGPTGVGVPARPQGRARRAAAAARRRAHDLLRDEGGRALRRGPDEVRGRHVGHRGGHRPRRRRGLARRDRDGQRPRPRARRRDATPWSASATWTASRCTARRPRGPRRGPVLLRRGRPPARRRGDHRLARRLRARRPPLRADPHVVLGVQATSRASFSVHSTREDVDALVAGILRVQEV
jgi:cysteine desulfurase/selenocysteine lyase